MPLIKYKRQADEGAERILKEKVSLSGIHKIQDRKNVLVRNIRKINNPPQSNALQQL
jgi:hypothetical protein